MAITSIGSGSAAVLLSSGGTAQQQITSVVVPRVPGGSVPAGQASRLVQMADVNSVSLPGGVLTEVVGPGGERRFEIRDDLQDQIGAIYTPGVGNAVLQNASYENGVLSYTGGTLSTPTGDRNGCALTVSADTQLTVGYQPDTLTAGQSLVYLWHTSADAATALTDYLSNGYPGLGIIATSNGVYVRVDGLSSGSLADPGPSVINLAGRRLQIDVPGVPSASYETPETAGPAPAYLHIFSINVSGGSAVADAAFDLSPAPSVASGLLPDEIAARIAGDAALQDQIDDVQTLAQVNQLNIAGKADQIDLDALQTTVSGQGITLAQKADQTALDALGTVVNGKATPADISAAIAALGGVSSNGNDVLLHFDGTLADAALLTSWLNPDGCGYAAGRFGQALAKTASQRGIYTPASDAFDFDTGDFTLECWLYAEGMSRDFGAIIGSGTVYWGAPSTFLMLTGNAQPSATKNRLHFGGNLLGTPLLMSGLLNAGQWYHVAISRAAGVCRMFVDGVVQATASYTGSISFADDGTWIGSNGWDGTNSYLDGRIDELRVTKGLARYTADFSPPTEILTVTGSPSIPGLSSSTPAAPTTTGAAGTATTAARGDHAHPLPTAAQITAAVLTGLATGSDVAIAAADTLLSALAKLQTQITRNRAFLPPKISSVRYYSGRWHDAAYPWGCTYTTLVATTGQQYFSPAVILEDMTISALGINVTAAGAAGATCQLGIYAADGASGEAGTALFVSGSLATGSTGAKTAACSVTLTAGTTVWLSFVALGASCTVTTCNALRQIVGSTSVTNTPFVGQYSTGVSSMPATAGTMTTSATSQPRVMFQT